MKTATDSAALPKVGKPGGGLPFFEWLIAKYILFPSIYRSTSNKQAKQLYKEETEKILSLTETLEKDKARQRVLIPRLRGLEDNSRYWSVAMVLEHLAIVGVGIGDAIEELTKGNTEMKPVLIQDVKPDPETSLETARESFMKASRSFSDRIEIDSLEKHPGATYPHPWFGPLNARQWYILAGRHQAIHRQQIETILEHLKS